MTELRPQSIWARASHPLSTGFLLTLGGLAAFALGLAVTHLSTVLISIGFALFLALGLDPIVRWFEARGLTRAWAIALVSALFAIAIAVVILLIVPPLLQQVSQLTKSIPSAIKDFQASSVYAWLENTLGTDASSIVTDVKSYLTQPSHMATIGLGVVHAGSSIATAVSGSVIVVVLSLYFLASLTTMKASLNRLMPARNRAVVSDMADQIAESVGGYLMGMTILALCNSLVAFVLHLVLQLPFAMLMAVVAFCLTLIPLVGSVLYWGVATSLALFSGWLPALIFAAVYLVYMQLEAYVLTPKVMGRAISVPGVLVIIGALVGGTLLGLLGALIAIPVTASILLIIKKVLIPRQDVKVDPGLAEG
ncbi:AI-2E family transporter [Microbacterium sp. A84]|uniref:AI-2E family transporter n=1 Tax=Microbacterium sp. A84 TaxID=3450715 RepID=UPI003F41E2DC